MYRDSTGNVKISCLAERRKEKINKYKISRVCSLVENIFENKAWNRFFLINEGNLFQWKNEKHCKNVSVVYEYIKQQVFTLYMLLNFLVVTKTLLHGEKWLLAKRNLLSALNLIKKKRSPLVFCFIIRLQLSR